MRVLLIGECYSDNLGDSVICETVAKILADSFENTAIDFLDLSGRIFYNTSYINIKNSKPNSLNQNKIFLKVYKYQNNNILLHLVQTRLRSEKLLIADIKNF